jgi:hypothetical protein
MLTKEKIKESMKDRKIGPISAIRKLTPLLIEDTLPMEKRAKVSTLENHLAAAMECIYDNENGGTPTAKLCEIVKTAIEDNNSLVRMMKKRDDDPRSIKGAVELTQSLAEVLQSFQSNLKSPEGMKKMDISLSLLEAIKVIYMETMTRILDTKEFHLYQNGKELIRQVMREEIGEKPGDALVIEHGKIVPKHEDKTILH